MKYTDHELALRKLVINITAFITVLNKLTKDEKDPQKLLAIHNGCVAEFLERSKAIIDELAEEERNK